MGVIKMASLDNYFRQHKEISEVISNIKNLIKTNAVNNAKDIAILLNSLSGKLKVHLSLEDKYLYPSLKVKATSKIIAEKFENEMGDLAKEFMNYKDKYNTGIKISENIHNFKNETYIILKELEKRIEKEEKELYIIN